MTGMLWLTQALDVLSRGERGVLVTVVQVKGSAPREPGAKMLVWESGMAGSVGGGRLESGAIAFAHRMLAAGDGGAPVLESFSLGPDLNQCCGGRVSLLFELLDASARLWLQEWAIAADEREPCAVVARCRGNAITRMFVRPAALHDLRLPELLQRPIRALLANIRAVHVIDTNGELYVIEPAGERRENLFLFGAGHVGKALVRALAPLPFRINWIDGRSDAFPPDMPAEIVKVVSASPPGEVTGAPPGTLYLVMTHSHPLDLEICAHVLRREDFGFLGLIGSETKRARFASRLRAIGVPPHLLGRLTCPIGIPGIGSKEPAAIAAAVAAQLLIIAERRQADRNPTMAVLEVGT
jgi:xanthine dehydrogenase accessory factor